MGIASDDARIEQQVLNQDYKELRDINEAIKLIMSVHRNASEIYNEGRVGHDLIAKYTNSINTDKHNLEAAARKIGNAKKHNENVRKLAKRVYNSIKKIRLAKKKETVGFLTRVEANTLVKCNNIKHLLDQAKAQTEQARSNLFNENHRVSAVITDTNNAWQTLQYLKNIIVDLFRIEKETEEALEQLSKEERLESTVPYKLRKGKINLN